jgi:hypothetical protein
MDSVKPTANGIHKCYFCQTEFEWNFIVSWRTPCEIKAEKNPTFADAIGRGSEGINYEVYATCPECFTRNKLAYMHKF